VEQQQRLSPAGAVVEDALASDVDEPAGKTHSPFTITKTLAPVNTGARKVA
jgi:hypothetical protein